MTTMAMARAVKQKFSLNSLRVKTTSPAFDDMAFDYDTDSPPYSPTPSAMERPSLHPRLVHDLRQACASLVNMTNPPDPDDEPDQHDALRRYEAERKAKYIAQARAVQAKAAEAEARRMKELEATVKRSQTRREQPARYSLRRRREDVQDPVPKPSLVHVAPRQRPATSTGTQDGHKKSLERLGARIEPLPPVHATIVQRGLNDKQKEAADLRHIRDSMHIRPKTSAAACVDYDVTSGASSNSGASSSSDDRANHLATSTGMTSAVITPNLDGRMSRIRRPSDESYRDEDDTEAWMRDIARRRADEYINSDRASRSGRRSTSRFSRRDAGSDDDRPGSRAGSIASSIADGFSNYFRHGSSADSVRSGRSGRSSSLGLSTRNSRSSSMSRRSSKGWWRNPGLKRKGSWASFRSARLNGEDSKGRGRDGEPNLNRPLPALPGLDQYRETKTHIGQLMKTGGRRRRKVKKHQISEPQPFLPLDTPYTATLPKASPGSGALFHHENHQTSFDSPQQPSSAPLPRPNGPISPLPPPVSQLPTLATSISTSALPKQRAQRDSSSTGASRKKDQASQQLPLIIRGPSYHKEIEEGVYPRPMDVNNGSATATQSAPATASASEASKVASEGADPKVKLDMPPRRNEHGAWEKKGGLKSRVGKLFGGHTKGGDGGLEGRAAVAS